MKTKEQLILEECVYPHHDMFKLDTVSNHLRKYEKTLENLAQKLAEEAMAHASNGLLSWTDDDHEDYTDGSDQKTGTVHPKGSSGGGHLEVSGLSTQAGTYKNGALRVIAYNKIKNRLDYFYFPKDVWYYNRQFTNKGIARLIISYSGRSDSYVWWAQKCKVRNFETLSQKSSNVISKV